MINMAFGLGQDQRGLILYKFNLMPELFPPPTPTPLPFLNPGGGSVMSRTKDDEEYWRKYKFEAILLSMKSETGFVVKFPIKDFKLININISDKKIKPDVDLDDK